jgi:hypothetical protein
MLVKFISFVITFFGTKRHQPIMFAGIALIASAIGVGAVVSVYNVPVNTAASTATKADDPTTETLSPQTPAKKDLHRDTTLPQPADATATSSAPATPTATTTVPTITITPSDATLSLKQGESLGTISATLSDASSALWSVSSDQATGLTISPTIADKTATAVTFSAKATAAGTYVLTIHAKDPARGGDLATKNITITVTPN